MPLGLGSSDKWLGYRDVGKFPHLTPNRDRERKNRSSYSPLKKKRIVDLITWSLHAHSFLQVHQSHWYNYRSEPQTKYIFDGFRIPPDIKPWADKLGQDQLFLSYGFLFWSTLLLMITELWSSFPEAEQVQGKLEVITHVILYGNACCAFELFGS